MISPARLATFEILLKIETQGAYASELLHADRMDALSAPDRALAMEIVMGVLRWRSRLDSEIARLSFTPFRKLDVEVLTALRMGAYQVLFLGRIPARAAINESVELVKHSRKASAAPLANAVLRKLPKSTNEVRAARHSATQLDTTSELDAAHKLDFATPSYSERSEGEPRNLHVGFASAMDLAREYAHPAWLAERWIAHYGAARAAAICRYDQQVPTTTLRLRDAAADAELRDAGVELEPGRLMTTARRVLRGDPARSPACINGRVFIQDEGSQLIAALVGRGTRILDCCAAPGGKTAALADRNPQAQIVAADLHEHRARLMHGLVRAPNVRVIAADARALPVSGQFDRILADVPCSGTGTLARNPEIKWRLKAEDLADLHARQVAILRAALDKVARGGRVVYSSCSLQPEENEAVVDSALAGRGELRVIDVADELRRLQKDGDLAWQDIAALTQGPFLRTIPGVQPCDGFFVAVIAKD